jgi:hypothetical protein
VGSVKLQFNGQVRTENVAPYSVAGDTSGAFNAATLSVGTHTLSATAYPQPNLGGTPLASLSFSFSVIDRPLRTPILLTEQNSDSAVAFNAATFVTDPFSIFTEQNFSSDKRTRVLLFVSDLDFPEGGVVSDVQVLAESSVLGTVPLTVEHIAKVPFFDWLTQIKVSLPDSLANAGDVFVRVSWNGHSSNLARVSIR